MDTRAPRTPSDTREPLKLKACGVIMRARISSGAKAVAAILLDHVNWRDPGKRCDPGIERIMKLASRSRSNVQEAIATLVREDFLSVDIHGGFSGRNQYNFNWDAIRRLDEDHQDALFPGRSRPCSPVQTGPGTRAQTLSGIPIPEPDSVISKHTAVPTVSKGQARQTRTLDRRARKLSMRQAAEQSAIRRWDADLRNHYAGDTERFETIIAAIDEARARLITNAEMHRRGDGLIWIREHVDELLGNRERDHD